MSLLIVTAYCESDAKQCVRLYKWIGQLGGIKNNRVLFVTDKKTPPELIKAVCAEAKPVCAGYETLLISDSPVGSKWPRGANWAFMQASKKVLEGYNQPFLWLEPDCSPTRKGWLEAIENEYAECGMKYMGSKMRNKPPLPEIGMWGIAVYHPDVYPIFMETTARRMNIAFDVTMANRLVPQAHDTKLIQCINGPGRQPQRVLTNHIKPETVLLHQDKWGDVINILSKPIETTPEVKENRETRSEPIVVDDTCDITVVITNFNRPEQLRMCFNSCIAADVPHLVVSTSGEDSKVKKEHRRIRKLHPNVIIDSIKDDRGCNEMWLRGVKHVSTRRTMILHDDDWLRPNFREILAGKYSDADVIHWDGAKHLNGDHYPGEYTTRPDLKDGTYPIGYLLAFLLTPNSNSISPAAVVLLVECVVHANSLSGSGVRILWSRALLL